MAVDNNDSGNTHPEENSPGSDKAPKQNPVRLTMGHYFCANCGEDSISPSNARCPRCQDHLRWDTVAL